jgi:hypothetical protein
MQGLFIPCQTKHRNQRGTKGCTNNELYQIGAFPIIGNYLGTGNHFRRGLTKKKLCDKCIHPCNGKEKIAVTEGFKMPIKNVEIVPFIYKIAKDTDE